MDKSLKRSQRSNNNSKEGSFLPKIRSRNLQTNRASIIALENMAYNGSAERNKSLVASTAFSQYNNPKTKDNNMQSLRYKSIQIDNMRQMYSSKEQQSSLKSLHKNPLGQSPSRQNIKLNIGGSLYFKKQNLNDTIPSVRHHIKRVDINKQQLFSRPRESFES